MAVPIARRWIDHRTFSSIGLMLTKRAWIDLLFGFILSGMMAATFLLITLQFNIVEFQGYNLTSFNEAISSSTGFVEFIRVFSFAPCSFS